MQPSAQDRDTALYARAFAILEGRANGHALPTLRKLAARGFAPAMSVLSDFVSDTQACRLLRKAARAGDEQCAYNLAVTYRNRGDLLNYRRSLAWAARLDPEAAIELRQFKTRFPYEPARRLRRMEPLSD